MTTTKMIDPVCGMEVDPVTAAAQICHEGTSVYFCAEGCRDAFIANPGRFTRKRPRGFGNASWRAWKKQPAESQ